MSVSRPNQLLIPGGIYPGWKLSAASARNLATGIALRSACSWWYLQSVMRLSSSRRLSKSAVIGIM